MNITKEDFALAVSKDGTVDAEYTHPCGKVYRAVLPFDRVAAHVYLSYKPKKGYMIELYKRIKKNAL